MALTFYWYPKCGTCKQAKKWFDDHEIAYELIDLVTATPTAEEIITLMNHSDVPAKRFFNTSGRVYRARNLKDELPGASLEEMAAILATDGMLIKRPLVTDGSYTTVGFSTDLFAKAWVK